MKLVSISDIAPRPGTARHAAYMALTYCIGQPKDVVLQVVDNAEKHWHKTNGRGTMITNPTGWLRLFEARFM